MRVLTLGARTFREPRDQNDSHDRNEEEPRRRRGSGDRVFGGLIPGVEVVPVARAGHLRVAAPGQLEFPIIRSALWMSSTSRGVVRYKLPITTSRVSSLVMLFRDAVFGNVLQTLG